MSADFPGEGDRLWETDNMLVRGQFERFTERGKDMEGLRCFGFVDGGHVSMLSVAFDLGGDREQAMKLARGLGPPSGDNDQW